MSQLEPALLNVKLHGLGAVLEGAKLFQCLVTDCMPQYYNLARSEFYSVFEKNEKHFQNETFNLW